MGRNSDALIDLAVSEAEMQYGRRLECVSPQVRGLAGVRIMAPKAKAKTWTRGEEAYLRMWLGRKTEEEIGLALGRSAQGVRSHWKRDLGLKAPSKADGVITAQQAAIALGIDSHKVAHWVDVGLIPGRLMAGDRKIRLIERVTFMRWACAPANWVWFDPKRVQDAHLKKLLKLEAKRWGDEWWTTRQVADYHGVSTGDVKRYIKQGRIRAMHLQYSLGGRHGEQRYWSNHFVLRSEATRPDLKFYGRGDYQTGLSERGKAWIKKALKMGMNSVDIGLTMKRKPVTVSLWIRRHFPKHHFPLGRASWSKFRTGSASHHLRAPYASKSGKYPEGEGRSA